jgi:CheY-like chemotaxis protein
VQIIEALAYPAIALGEVTLAASLALRTTGLVELDRRGLMALTGWMILVAAPLSAVAAAAVWALDALLADPGGVDLLLTDLTTPSMTGMALAQHARRRRADLPVVIATGVPSAVTHDEGFAILPKP